MISLRSKQNLPNNITGGLLYLENSPKTEVGTILDYFSLCFTLD